MSKQLRVAIAGTGFIGRVHARSARLAGAHLVGVASSSAESARKAAGELGAERHFESAEALVTAPDVDVVHICTPNALHEPLALAALKAGKHVVCEKPLAMGLAGAQRLLDAARAHGRVATVPFVYRFYPTVREARAQVVAGTTGPLRLLHGTYLQDWLASPDDWNWRVDPERGGDSRAFADIGSHWCDLVEFVSGHRITRVSARLSTTVAQRLARQSVNAFASGQGSGRPVTVSTEDVALVHFETHLGAVGSLVISQVSPGRKNRLWFELDGADAALAFDQEQPESLWVGRRSGPSLVLRDPGHLSAPAARLSPLPAGHPQGYHDCFDLFVADTYAAIAGAEPDGLPRFEDGVRAARITDAVLASARTQSWVEVPA
ncbi:Gfo/Idh/MocA family oxidoreductase [Archangium violaceum]|uniref:Gfo/Idh/MocA family protein n=1 Tax=Archangium violaceum TaxID=83451 RepID=UPI00193B532C|nr:Gfo/Idh/MocA family oxidoreductase [Archangium violaceum]QRK11246.1 Gfo/Idh/MocA family oxidoreductase [Archangium violaceum]